LSLHALFRSQYGSIIDPNETWLEKWLLHEANEVYNYFRTVRLTGEVTRPLGDLPCGEFLARTFLQETEQRLAEVELFLHIASGYGSGLSARLRRNRRLLSWAVGRIEHHVRQPALEIRVVAELLEELCMVVEQLQHHAVERLVVLQPRVLLTRVGLRVLVGLVLRHARRNLFGDDLANLVGVMPLDVAEQVVELLDDVRQPVQLWLAATSTTSRRWRFDECVRVVHRHPHRSLGLSAVAVHVDGFQHALGQILLL